MAVAVALAYGFYEKANLTYPSGTTESLAFQPIDIPTATNEIDQYRGGFPVSNYRPPPMLQRTDNFRAAVPGSKALVTADVPYLMPRVNCNPVFNQSFDVERPNGPGLMSWQFGDLDRTLTLSANTTAVEIALGDLGDMMPELSGIADTVTESMWNGNITIHTSEWTASNIQITLAEIPQETPVRYSTPNCTTFLSAFGASCGSSKDEFTCLENMIDSDSPLPKSWFLDMSVPRDCDDHALVLILQSCSPGNGSAATNNARLKIGALECTSDNHYGKATVAFQNNHDGPPPDIMRLQELAWNGTWKPYGNDLFTFTLGTLAGMPQTSNYSNDPSVLGKLIKAAGKDMSDAQTAKAAVEEFYPFLAVQLFRATSFVAGSDSISGKIDTEISRLTVKALSFWCMVTLLQIVSGACVVLLVLGECRQRPFQVLPSHPPTLAVSITLLASHPHLKGLLQGMMIQQNQWRKSSSNTRKQSWKPRGTTRTSTLVTIGAITTAIGLLPVTKTISTAKDGLVLVTVDHWASYGWTLAPSSLVTILKLSVSAMDDNIRIVEPFARLSSHQRSPSVNGLFEDFLSGLLPWRLWVFARTRRFALVAVTLGAMLMPLSVVIVGDLFVISSQPSIGETFPLLQLDGFDETATHNWTSKKKDQEWIPGIGWKHINTSPLLDFTTDEFAIASFKFPNPELMEFSSAKSLSVTTLAITGRLNCTVVGTHCERTQRPSIENNSTHVSCNENSWEVPIDLVHREGCPSSFMRPSMSHTVCSDSGAVGFFNLTRTIGANSSTAEDLKADQILAAGTVGIKFIELKDNETSERIYYRLDNTTLHGMFGIMVNNETYEYRAEDNDCPSILNYGEEVIGDCETSSSTTAICDPYLEVGEASVVLSLPDLRIQSITRQSANLLPTRKYHLYGMSRFLLGWQDSLFEDPRGGAAGRPGESTPLSGPLLSRVFRAITSSTISLEDLRRTDSASRARVIASIKARWARAVAHVIRSHEFSASGYDPPKLVDAALMDTSKRRLVQTEASTRIPQSIFGLTAMCLIIGVVFGSKGMDKLLPSPPTSIGALIRLLVGSKILGQQEYDDGFDDSEVKSRSYDDDDEGTADCEPAMEDRKRTVSPSFSHRSWRVKWSNGIVPPGAENMSDLELRRVFDVPGRVYCLKEWDVEVDTIRENANTESDGEVDGEADVASATSGTEKRYGIDFEEDQDESMLKMGGS